MPHKIWTVGEEVLAADFNSYLQNQTVPQFPNAAARDTWVAPPKGALCVTTDTNTMWQHSGTAWVVFPIVPPHVRVYRTAAGAIAHNTGSAIIWDGEDPDASGMHTPSGTRLTAPVAGFYRFGASVIWAPHATGYRSIALRLNDAAVVANTGGPAIAIFEIAQCVVNECQLSAGHWLDVIAYQNSGANLNIQTGASAWMTYVCP